MARRNSPRESGDVMSTLTSSEPADSPKIVLIDPRTGHEVWHSPPLNGGIARESVHFFDVEGRRRVSLATELGVYVSQ